MTPGRSARVSRAPFDALGHATRRAIVEQLRDGPRSVAEITASTSISQPSVSRHLRQLAFAANTLTVVAAQLLILRRLAGHQRTTAVALAAAWAASWAMMTAAGHLGGGAAAVTAFAAAMVIFALGECLLSPTLPAIINDLAPPGAAGRYNGPGALAFTTGFLAGPAGGAALGASFGTASNPEDISAGPLLVGCGHPVPSVGPTQPRGGVACAGGAGLDVAQARA